MRDANFKVFVRCRTKDSGGPSAYDVQPPTDLIRKGVGKKYTFDRVFAAQQDQSAVFETCALPLVDEFLRGYNGTMFAYGQTGTGKTYTMTGDCRSPDSPAAGIVPRVLHSVFKKLEESQREEWSLELRYVELYNEELRDLLDPCPPSAKQRGAKQLRIAENQLTHSTEVFGATSHAVTSCESALAVIRGAQARRQTAATLLNSDSSRSHTVLTLVLVVREPVSGMAVRSKLHLVDLAGSESVAKSGALRQRAVEAGEINKSLLALGRVIEALVDAEKVSNGKPRYVSYRASKLTQLLQDSLGGATKTSMVATVSVSAQDADETRSTLDYALRARSIKNQQQTEVELLDTLPTIKEMSRRLEEVQRELTAQRTRDGYVCISNARYEQLASGEQRAAKVLAQHETATRHERARYEQVQQENARLEAQLSALTAEHQNCSNAVMTHTRLQQTVTALSTASQQHASLATETCEALYAKMSELPSRLSQSVAELRSILEGPSSSAQLQSECTQGIRHVFEDRSFDCQKLINEFVKEAETELKNSVSGLLNAWQKSAQTLHRPLTDAATLTSHLASLMEEIQQRIAQELAANAEAVALARDLMMREQKSAEALKELQEASQERQALARRLIDSGKAGNVQLPLLSARAGSAGECVANIREVVSQPAPSISRELGEQATQQLSRLLSRVHPTLSEQWAQLEGEVKSRVHDSIETHDVKVQVPAKRRLVEATQAFDGIRQDYSRYTNQVKPDLANFTLKNASLAQAMARFQREIRSVPPSPQRGRSSSKSPTRSPTRSPSRSPKRSPHRHQTLNGSPRKVLPSSLRLDALRRPGSGPTPRVLALERPKSGDEKPLLLREIGNEVNMPPLRMSETPKLVPSQHLQEVKRDDGNTRKARIQPSSVLSEGALRRSPRRGGSPTQKRIKRL